MERIIEGLEKDLRNIVEGKPLQTLRKKLGDEADIRLCRIMIFALQWTSVGYQSALRLAGMKFGKRMGESSKTSELSLILDEIKKIFENLKAGKVEIEIMTEMKGAQLKIYESSLTAEVPNVLQKLCFFEEGFIEGYLDGVISKMGPLAIAGQEVTIAKVSVEEKRCVGLGDDFCGFLIKFSS
jgi:predicted hydrocarbon binding protein